MIVVYGRTKCIYLEENIFRFLDAISWGKKHKCILKKNKCEIRIKAIGTILIEDDILGDIELCDVYDYDCKCKTCGKGVSFIYEDKIDLD